MTKILVALIVTMVLPALLCVQLHAQDTHPFSVHDMLAMDRIGDPQVSPDGKTVAFTLRKTDLDANKGQTDIWLVGVDGSGLRRLTANPAGDWNPRWTAGGFGNTRTSADVRRLNALYADYLKAGALCLEGRGYVVTQ